MSVRDEIKMEGSLLAVGESRRVLCAECHGGRSQERSMNLTRTADGVLYHCHRVSCTLKPGFVGGSAAVLGAKPKDSNLKPYQGALLPLSQLDVDFFDKKYEVAASDYIQRNEHSEYVLPIFGHDGYIRGYNVRQPWPGAPRHGREGAAKAKVWMHADKPSQSTYPADLTSQAVVLVEDQLSAIKASQHASVTHAVALMGCHLDIPRVREIALLRPYEVLLALDSDATAEGFKLAREFGLAFPRMRVVILDRDLKDTPAAEINKVLGL